MKMVRALLLITLLFALVATSVVFTADADAVHATRISFIAPSNNTVVQMYLPVAAIAMFFVAAQLLLCGYILCCKPIVIHHATVVHAVRLGGAKNHLLFK